MSLHGTVKTVPYIQHDNKYELDRVVNPSGFFVCLANEKATSL